MNVTFSLTTEGFSATVSAQGDLHPDALDELSRRCVRLFVEANASLPDEPDE